MDTHSEIAPDRRERALKALSEKPDGVVESIAAGADVTAAEILAVLPEGSAVIAGKERFDEIWSELTTWGVVLFLVHTEDVVAEIDGILPAGSESHGWFNIHGDSPIGGHIKASNCAAIYIVDRQLPSRRVCSVQFFNGAGEVMFKVFVRRDAQRALLPDQLEKFETLKTKFI